MKMWFEYMGENTLLMFKNIFGNDSKIPNLEEIYIDKIVLSQFSLDIYFYFPMPKRPPTKMLQKGTNILYANFNILEIDKLDISKNNFLHNSLEIWDIGLKREKEFFSINAISNYKNKIFCKFKYISLPNFGGSIVEESFLNQLPNRYKDTK